MRIIVTGDRNWYCRPLAREVVGRLVARYGPGLVVVHGDCRGVDRAFAEAAELVGLATEAHPVTRDEWGALGRKAGPERNARMVRAGAELAIVCHRSLGLSGGTKDCARRAVRAGIPTYLIDSDEAKPVRLRPGDARLQDFRAGRGGGRFG